MSRIIQILFFLIQPTCALTEMQLHFCELCSAECAEHVQHCLHHLLLSQSWRTRESLNERRILIIFRFLSMSSSLPHSLWPCVNRLAMPPLTRSDQSIFLFVSFLSECQQFQVWWCSSPPARWG